VHLGVMVIANFMIGYVAAPAGINLFLSSFRFERSMFDVWRTTVPFFLVLFLVLGILTAFPSLSLLFVPEMPALPLEP
jgi:TRAP-type C4-dicarboxylate transport system permease large subunit